MRQPPAGPVSTLPNDFRPPTVGLRERAICERNCDPILRGCSAFCQHFVRIQMAHSASRNGAVCSPFHGGSSAASWSRDNHLSLFPAGTCYFCQFVASPSLLGCSASAKRYAAFCRPPGGNGNRCSAARARPHGGHGSVGARTAGGHVGTAVSGSRRRGRVRRRWPVPRMR